MRLKNLLVIIPAFNEERVITETVKGVRAVLPGDSEVLVIDDGSNDRTGDLAKEAGVRVVRHPINRGLGGALGTGIYWAKTHDVNFAITFDADGQHDPQDIRRILKLLRKNDADVVIGSRTQLGWRKIPLDRKVMIKLSNWLTWWLFGIKTSDSTSGLRGFNRRAIERIMIKTDKMEVSNEFFGEIKRNSLRVKEVPIRVIYTDYSRSKGQKNSNAIDVLVKLLLRLFR